MLPALRDDDRTLSVDVEPPLPHSPFPATWPVPASAAALAALRHLVHLPAAGAPR